MAAKKTTKKATKKKAVRKKAATKKTPEKKTTRKKKAGIKGELPASLKALGRQLRRDFNAIEKQLETAGHKTSRSLSRVLRESSHTLGALEARGEKEWRKLSKRTRNEVEKTVKRVQKAAKG